MADTQIEYLNTEENKTDMCDIGHARLCKGHSARVTCC